MQESPRSGIMDFYAMCANIRQTYSIFMAKSGAAQLSKCSAHDGRKSGAHGIALLQHLSVCCILFGLLRAKRACYTSWLAHFSGLYIYICIHGQSIWFRVGPRKRATRKRLTGRLKFNGQYNRLENGYFRSKP